MKKTILALIFCVVAVGIFAQEKQSDKAFLMFLHGGYCMLPNKTAGLTSTSDDYVKKMGSGASWNAQAFFRTKMFIVGLMYSGFTSKGSYVASLETSELQLKSSDNLLTTYVGPQFGMNIPVAEKFDIGWNGGFGGMFLKNNGQVFEKPRVLKGGNIGCNLGVRGVVNFTPNIGLSAEIMAIGAYLNKANSHYHDEVVRVHYVPSLKLNQFTFSLGLKISI